MTFYEILSVTVEELKPIFLVFALVLAITLVMLFVSIFITKNYTIDSARFRFAGFFFQLSPWNAVFAACAWIKMVTLIVLLCIFQSLTVMHYITFLIPGLFYLFQPGNVKRIPASIGWLVMELAGLVSANLICRYYLEISRRPIVVWIYVAAAIFVAAFGILRFLYEVEEISDTREFSLEEVAEELEDR